MTPSNIMANWQICENSRVIVHGSIGLWFNRCSIFDGNLVRGDLEAQKAVFRGGIVIAMPGLNFSLSVSGRLYYGGLGEVREAVVVGYLRRCDVDGFAWMLADVESVSLMEDMNASGLPSPLVLTPEDVRYAAECRLKNLESVSTGPEWEKKVAEQRVALSSW